MNNKIPIFILVGAFLTSGITTTITFGQLQHPTATKNLGYSGNYTIQWSYSYGSSAWTCARYQGPQPIGDADNDGKNEFLISGRDRLLRVMKWNEQNQTYIQVQALHPPLYPLVRCSAGGMAIGDVMNNGKNQIAATWYTALYQYSNEKYNLVTANPWIFFHGGGSSDCLIGDFDNDGQNELILSGIGYSSTSPVGEITVFRWNGVSLKRIAEWNDPDAKGNVYMAGLGDVNNDGKNEIACAYANKVMVLQWDAGNNVFHPTLIQQYPNTQQGGPFGCVCKDCDGDGKAEILVSFYAPRITIFKWNGSGYTTQFDITWKGADPVIEGIDAGDTDGDGIPNVVAGAGVTHVLQWNGTTYVETATLPTYGWMAVECIGDCDNDGKNEINAGNVDVDTSGQPYMEWIFKYEPST
ncbi:Repeat domain in Vibrio, Colwellia, Bradyrhizobium and Shewanella [uncultured archaeon]|nr:Repeat domain in Vibrio, Colwellia, Bradyrhizobium and Shewanella [uncultured archaeon]